MRNKRAWTRGEKWLWASPLLLAVMAGGVWLWKRDAPITIPLKDVSEIAFSPDGKRVAVLIGRIEKARSGMIFDTATGERKANLLPVSPNISLSDITWAPDGSRLATTWTDGKKGTFSYSSQGRLQRNTLYSIAIWNAASGAQISSFPYAPSNEFVYPRLEWRRGNHLRGIGAPDSLFDVKTGKRRRFGPPFDPASWQPRMMNADYKLIATQVTGAILINEVPSGRLLRKIPTPNPMLIMRWSQNDADVIAIHWEDKSKKGALRTGTLRTATLRLLNARTGRSLPLPPITHPDADEVVFGRKGQIAIRDTHGFFADESGGYTNSSTRVLMWDYGTTKMLWQYEVEDNRNIFGFDSSPDGRHLSVLNSYSIYGPVSRIVWDAATGKEIWRCKVDDGRTKIVWAPNGDSLAIRTRDSIQIYRLRE